MLTRLIGVAAVAVIALAVVPRSLPGEVQPIKKPRWLDRVLITEYYPVPERWFRGMPVSAPGLSGLHRVDWLYSGRGLSMEGDGIGLDGRRYNIARTGEQGWVDEQGKPTVPTARGWSRGFPFWRGVGWRNKKGDVTFPIAGRGWYRGAPRHYIAPKGIEFGQGPSRPLRFWRSVAVDPKLIPLGSRIFVPALCSTPSRGWVIAEDVGGAIIGRHLDLYRPAPSSPEATVDQWKDVPIFVLPPGATPPQVLPSCKLPVFRRVPN